MELKDIRKEIDLIDNDILNLFLRRMDLSEQVAECKKAHDLPVLNRERERNILARVQEQAGGREEYAYYLFSRIMDLSRARQNELLCVSSPVQALVENALAASTGEVFPKTGTVACQGLEGSNAQAACDKLLPRGNIMYFKTFKAVFDAVGSGLCKYGVLPIENSSNGSVRAVYELLLEHNFFIVRSTSLCIRHELLSKECAKLENIRRIYSHPQAIGQCSHFLSTLSDVQVIPCENTAVAAKLVAEDESGQVAAIAAPQCKELYKLTALKSDIQDSDNNYTRFICISKDPVIYSGSNRISLVISCENRPGALNDILSRLSARGINMSKLESCPVTGRNFEFIFFLELDASVQDDGVLPLLSDLERICPSFALLGSYAIV